MQQLSILNSKKRKNVAKIINKQFGCDFSFDYEVFMNSKNKLFLLNKDVSKINLDNLRVNSLGLYFGVIYDNEIRVSIEGSQILGKIATKNVLDTESLVILNQTLLRSLRSTPNIAAHHIIINQRCKHVSK